MKDILTCARCGQRGYVLRSRDYQGHVQCAERRACDQRARKRRVRLMYKALVMGILTDDQALSASIDQAVEDQYRALLTGR